MIEKDALESHQWYSTPTEEAISLLQSDMKHGLSETESKARLESYGQNALKEAPHRTALSMFVDQINEPLILMLMAAAVISIIVGEWEDAIVILLIVALNAILGVVQENRAEKAMDALKQLSKPVAKVVRDGHTMQVPSNEVVPGDIVLLEAGDFIPADVRLLEQAALRVDESALTGESIAVEKYVDALSSTTQKPALGDQHNMGFMGTVVTYGRGRGLVVRTGMQTEIGNIASLIQEAPQESTPLQKHLGQLGKILGVVAIVLVVIVFVTGVLRGEAAFDMFMTAISLAVAAVPEGLPAIVTIVLALGVQRMSKQNAIIRRLPAVETLGAATVICSDKTGTLTKNEMTVVSVYADDTTSAYTPSGPEKSTPAMPLLLQAGLLASDATIEEQNGRLRVIGDPTEGALVAAAKYGGFAQVQTNEIMPRVAELPFDSSRKLMTTIHRVPLGAVPNLSTPYVAFTKGAPDVLSQRCVNICEHDEVRPLDEELRTRLNRVNAEYASKGLRVLAVAYRLWDVVPEQVDSTHVEDGLTFLGFYAMQDPARPEAKSAVQECLQAGIRPVMITGDHPDTAIAIAKELGIWQEGDQTLIGAQLEEMSDNDLQKVVEDVSVYARVSPEHKLRIVDALKSHNHVVAMTGDGVNDAPALKRADIGAAMGITGTDVAKEAADMVLTDDNFATIVSAVRAGRSIFSNIRKVVHYLLSCNIGEIVAIFAAIALGLGRPLTAIQILWLNLVTDGLPALALGVDPPEKDVMRHKPRNPKANVLGDGLGIALFWQGLLLGGLTLLGYWHTLSIGRPMEEARTVAFLILSLSQIVHSLNTRSRATSIFKLGIASNRALVGAMVVSALLQLVVVVAPFFQPIFDTVSLPIDDWLWVTGLSLTPLLISEVVKLLSRKQTA
jgi:Ca2+-transporting ATPase